MAFEVEPIKPKIRPRLLIEIAWEVCNQVGGIYTVIRSKVPAMVEKWGDDYFLLGPYFPDKALAEFEPITDLDDSILGKTVRKMRDMGFDVQYGYWLVTGKPRLVLFNFNTLYDRLDQLKYDLWNHHQLSTLNAEDLVNQVVAFGECVRVFLNELSKDHSGRYDITAHFHEWMAATALPDLAQEAPKLATVFTTHATMLGRYMAPNVPNFYDNLPSFNWLEQAKHFGIETQATIEYLAAQHCHVMTTVSDVTARECEFLLGRKCDLTLPNGLNVTRFTATHEFQNLHVQYKQKIHQFVMGHFFQNYSFDLDRTLYFFTSGRFEYSNKGYDLTLEALNRLNAKLQASNSDMTVVMFIVTKNPVYSMDADVLQTRAVMAEIRQTCEAIERQIGEQLFMASATSNDLKMPDLNQFVDEYWQLRLRRTIQSWKTHHLPKTVTHYLKQEDAIVDFLRKSNMQNHETDRVKIVYHPDFIASTNPLFGMDYSHFVRGCHLGIFPSYYEPWGYTPLECVVRGVPTVTSDLSGFGDYMNQIMADPENWGVYVLNRSEQDFHQAAETLSELLFKFVRASRRDRIMQRNRTESISEVFDWKNLRSYYDTAHDLALKRRKYS
ncbi:glycogen synthase [Siphonobacter sp.]|uniref:glycogen synthase n=1 Tax=Siphonobacter sp. TaxID=1869184 RepID=UPI003B3A15BF